MKIPYPQESRIPNASLEQAGKALRMAGVYSANTPEFSMCPTEQIRPWDPERRCDGERTRLLSCTFGMYLHRKGIAEPRLLNKTLSAWTKAMRHHKKPRHVTGICGVFSGGLSTRLGEADWHLRWVFFYFIIQGRFLFCLEFEVWDCRSVLATEFLHTPSYHILQVLLINSEAHISFYKSILSFCWYQTRCWRNRKK